MNSDMPSAAHARNKHPGSAGEGQVHALSPRTRDGDRATPHRILLFTSSLGSGHMRATQAIEHAIRERMPHATVRTLDFWSLMDDKVAWAVRTAYLRLVQEHTELYDRVYQLDQHTWRAILESSKPLPPEIAEITALVPTRFPNDSVMQKVKARPTDRVLLLLLRAVLSANPRNTLANNRLLRLALVQSTWARLSRRCTNFIQGFNPDVMVATQMSPAALLTATKQSGQLKIPTLGVLTDFGVHDFWIQPGIDLYCLAHESLAAPRSSGIPADKVIVSGIPLMPGFRQPPDARQAQRELNLDPERPVILVVGGGLGLGVDAVAARLLAMPNDAQILVIAGRNPSAHQALAPLIERYPGRLHVWDWTEQMEVFIRAADVVIGKPGGLTVAEVLACGRPLIATHALQGQEGFNIRFLEQHGVGQLVPETRLEEVLDSLLQNPQALADMKSQAMKVGHRNGADLIAGRVEQYANSHPRRRTAGVS